MPETSFLSTVSGIIFMTRGINLISCRVLNWTTSDINAQYKSNKACNVKSFTLRFYDLIEPALESRLHAMLRTVRDSHGEVTLVLLSGPSDWSSKQTVFAHATVPSNQLGAWSIIHPDYEEMHDRYRLEERPNCSYLFNGSFLY